MNRTQRPNFVLVCIAVILVSFSFASEMLCKLSNDGDVIISRPDTSQVAAGQIMPSLLPTVAVSQPFTENRLTANGLASVVFQDINPLQPAEDIIEPQLIPSPASESKTALIQPNNQFIYKALSPSQSKNTGARLVTRRAVDARTPSSAKTVSRNISRKQIAISIRRTGFLGLLLNNKRAAKDILQQAVAQLNLSEDELEKIKFAVANKVQQKMLREDDADDSAIATSEKIMNFLRELNGQSPENKIYVLKNLSADKLKILRQILNAHNITLRAFITS